VGDVTVGSGGWLSLGGTVGGRVIVLAGVTADIRGVVMGAVEVLGRVTIGVGAKVNERVLEADGTWSSRARQEIYVITDDSPRFNA
jgi:hypothetical protein